MSAVVLQQVFIADDLHGKAGADQRAEDRLRRADHDAFLLTAVGIFAVSAGQQSLYGGILGRQEKHLYAAAIGYDEVIELSEELYDITNSIEKAVLWRSMPECAGSIIVFIRNDTDKLHSLAEFEVITTRDTARYLVESQLKLHFIIFPLNLLTFPAHFYFSLHFLIFPLQENSEG